jgi:TonB family protein
MSTAPQPASGAPPRQPDILPTLFGAGYGTYAVSSTNFYWSFLLHTIIAAAVILLSYEATRHAAAIKAAVTDTVIDVGQYMPMPVSKSTSGGGGSGGDRDKLDASHGVPPKFAKQQITPPTTVIRNPNPVLAVEPTVVVPQLRMNMTGDVGVLSSVLKTPSNGPGYGGGIGNNEGGGVGTGNGRGYGTGGPAGCCDGIYQVGGGVSAPRVIYQLEPEYSEEGRKAKYQGVVVVQMVVDRDGKVRDAHVVRSLGLGLDEKALEAVRQWKFEPAKKNSQAVAVGISVEVSFRLF